MRTPKTGWGGGRTRFRYFGTATFFAKSTRNPDGHLGLRHSGAITILAEVDRKIAGVRLARSRRKLRLQEVLDKAAKLLIGGDGDHIAATRPRFATASYLCTESAFWPVRADAGATAVRRRVGSSRLPLRRALPIGSKGRGTKTPSSAAAFSGQPVAVYVAVPARAPKPISPVLAVGRVCTELTTPEALHAAVDHATLKACGA